MTDVQREILNAFVASAAELANLATHMHSPECGHELYGCNCHFQEVRTELIQKISDIRCIMNDF